MELLCLPFPPVLCRTPVFSAEENLPLILGQLWVPVLEFTAEMQQTLENGYCITGGSYMQWIQKGPVRQMFYSIHKFWHKYLFLMFISVLKENLETLQH